MPKFSEGDRVRMISHDEQVPFGTIGTVLDNSLMPDVEWDNWNDGYSGPFYDGRKTVLAVLEGHLELVPTEEACPVEPDETLRDLFAIMGLLAVVPRLNSGHHTPEKAANWCYRFADAMLKERAGK